MNPPDFGTCREEELWHYVAWHLEGAGIHSVLVGGAVVSIYTEGLYRSGDLDMVLDRYDQSGVFEILEKIGFKADKSRYFKHPECTHLFLEFPKGPVELGEQYPVTPDEILVEGRTLRLLSPTDCVKDRLAAYIHWKARAGFNQAVLVCRRQQGRVDFGNVAAWCQREGNPAAFEELVQRLSELEIPDQTSP
jgi:hypothetical protein